MIDDLKEKMASLKERASSFSILYVEDELELREGMLGFFGKIFKHVESAGDGVQGLKKYTQGNYDIVITDIRMPNMNGIDLIRHIRKIDEHQEVIVISAYTDPEFLTQSIQLDVTGYIIKPIDLDQVVKILEQSIYRLTAFRENEMYKIDLESMVKERTKTVLDLQHQQVENYQHAIHSLVKMVEARDTYTGGHSERVARYSRDIAKEMGLTEEECAMIYEAGILHDIGKIVTPDAILLKPGKLTDDEYSLIKDHVIAGYEILNEIPMYNDLAEIVYAHHEHHDGSGYPRGIKGEEIPIYARIMMVADAFDAMTTSRIYKAKMSIAEAIEELRQYSGIWYDSKVVESAIKILASVNISTHVEQMPDSQIDDERFAYFYKDPLTRAYNQYYLDFVLQHYEDQASDICLNVLYLQGFTSYNQKNGWDEGDALLSGFSSYLRSEFPTAKLFRIFGDDFVLMHENHLEIDIDRLNASSLLKSCDLHCTHRHFDLREADIKSYKDLQE